MSHTPAHVDHPAAPPRRNRTTTTAVAVAVAVLILAAAGVTVYLTSGGTTDPAGPATTAASAPQTAAAQATPAICPNGRLPNGDCAGGTSAVPKLAGDTMAPIVCPKILQAQQTQAIYNDPDAMEAIGKQAGTSLDLELALAGDILSSAARQARFAKGTGDEAAKSIGMGSAATQLATVCIKGGFQQ